MCIFCDADEHQTRDYGRAFGYPDCCIEEFIQDLKIMDESGVDVRNNDQIDIARRTMGFVPCKNHTEMIINGHTTPEDLVITKRNIEKSKELNRLVEEYLH